MDEQGVIRGTAALRTPFAVEHLPFLARLYRAAHRQRRRGSARLVGKPLRRLFGSLHRAGYPGTGTATLVLSGMAKRFDFDARNVQFSALYAQQNLPCYEAGTSALLDRIVPDRGVFMDIGANWGWFALLIASRPGFAGSIHAFEPIPSSFHDLESTVRQLGLESVIQCHRIALGDRDGEARLAMVGGVNSACATLDPAGGVTSRIARLDGLGLPPPDVIKIDVENHELEAFIGAEQTIDRARPIIVFENSVMGQSSDGAMAPIRFLAGKGYRFYSTGWVVRGDDDRIVYGGQPQDPSQARLALVPVLPAHRFLLPGQINLVGIPAERVADVDKAISRA